MSLTIETGQGTGNHNKETDALLAIQEKLLGGLPKDAYSIHLLVSTQRESPDVWTHAGLVPGLPAYVIGLSHDTISQGLPRGHETKGTPLEKGLSLIVQPNGDKDPRVIVIPATLDRSSWMNLTTKPYESKKSKLEKAVGLGNYLAKLRTHGDSYTLPDVVRGWSRFGREEEAAEAFNQHMIHRVIQTPEMEKAISLLFQKLSGRDYQMENSILETLQALVQRDRKMLALTLMPLMQLESLDARLADALDSVREIEKEARWDFEHNTSWALHKSDMPSLDMKRVLKVGAVVGGVGLVISGGNSLIPGAVQTEVSKEPVPIVAQVSEDAELSTSVYTQSQLEFSQKAKPLSNLPISKLMMPLDLSTSLSPKAPFMLSEQYLKVLSEKGIQQSGREYIQQLPTEVQKNVEEIIASMQSKLQIMAKESEDVADMVGQGLYDVVSAVSSIDEDAKKLLLTSVIGAGIVAAIIKNPNTLNRFASALVLVSIMLTACSNTGTETSSIPPTPLAQGSGETQPTDPVSNMTTQEVEATSTPDPLVGIVNTPEGKVPTSTADISVSIPWAAPSLEQAKAGYGGPVPSDVVAQMAEYEALASGTIPNATTIESAWNQGTGDAYRLVTYGRNAAGNILWSTQGDGYSEYPMHWIYDDEGNISVMSGWIYTEIPDSKDAVVIFTGSTGQDGVGEKPAIVKDIITLSNGTQIFARYWDGLAGEWKINPNLSEEDKKELMPDPNAPKDGYDTKEKKNGDWVYHKEINGVKATWTKVETAPGNIFYEWTYVASGPNMWINDNREFNTTFPNSTTKMIINLLPSLTGKNLFITHPDPTGKFDTLEKEVSSFSGWWYNNLARKLKSQYSGLEFTEAFYGGSLDIKIISPDGTELHWNPAGDYIVTQVPFDEATGVEFNEYPDDEDPSIIYRLAIKTDEKGNLYSFIAVEDMSKLDTKNKRAKFVLSGLLQAVAYANETIPSRKGDQAKHFMLSIINTANEAVSGGYNHLVFEEK